MVSVVVAFGVAAASLMAMASGKDGQVSAFWMAAAPLIALSTGGQRAGWTVLVVSAVAITLTMLGIERVWVEPFMGGERTVTNRTISLLGMALLIFLLKARAPEKYRDRVQMQHADADGKKLPLAAVEEYVKGALSSRD